MEARLLFIGNEDDRVYLPRLKSLVGTASVTLLLDEIHTWAEVKLRCQKRGVTGILSTNRKLLALVSGDEKPSLDAYAGSYFLRDGIEIVFLDPLAQLVSLPYGSFVTARYCSKLCAPERWAKYPAFTWELGHAGNLEYLYHLFSQANLIAIDIETTQTNLAITSIAYTCVFLRGYSTPRLHSFVLELDSTYNLAWMRKFNSLPAPKIFQNGKYDNSYLLRYDAVVTNWLFDTATAMHSWYSELPKDLATLSAFFHREGRYWKNMASGDMKERLEYNCRDTYATAIVMCEWLREAPLWAKTNYLQEFPLLFPCLLAEMTGIKRDMEALKAAYLEVATQITTLSASLDTMLGVKNFNVNSPVQMKQLLTIVGCRDIAAESTDEKHLEAASFRHPLIARILSLVLEIRGLRKLNSTYLVPGKEFEGRILSAFNPHGTDTGRLASREHHFWCGLQAQNIPAGVTKTTLVADDGFRIAEVDLEQAESRDTAFISGSESMIVAVSGVRDFHSVNASCFFGIPYTAIYDDSTHKVLDKLIRTVAKRVNHGANYNMGPGVLVQTMGLEAVYAAGKSLKLPAFWTALQIATYLLQCFHKTYPTLESVYYAGVIAEITTTKMITSRAVHDSEFDVAGWTRYCFSDPTKNKRAKNAYVAHPPQSLNAMTLNKAFLKVFYEISLDPEKGKNFRLLGQVHDSILVEYRLGYECLAEEVKEYMQIPVTIIGYDGKKRTFTVPAALKLGGKSWEAIE